MRSISSVFLTTITERSLESRVFNDPRPQQIIAAAHQRLNVSAHHIMKNGRLVAVQLTAVTRLRAATCNLSLICCQKRSLVLTLNVKRYKFVLHRDANETFSFETEMRPRCLKVCSRRDRGETFPIFPETETRPRRDVHFWLQDETKTETFLSETETFFETLQTAHSVKFKASNWYKLCCVSFVITQTV